MRILGVGSAFSNVAFRVRHRKNNARNGWFPRLIDAVHLPLCLLLAVSIQWFCSVNTALSQEALRSSLAGQEAMEAKKRALTAGKYNVRFANIALELGARLGVELNDNVFYSPEDKISDISFRPQLTGVGVWMLTDKNRLNLSMGIGYAKYIQNPHLDTPFLTPDSDLSFDVYVRDIVINFHDRFSLQQDVSAQLISVTNVAYLERFENTVGVMATWDLNKAVVSAGYDHYNFVSLTRLFDYQTRQSELFFGRAMFAFNPVTSAGVELGGGMTAYDQSWLSDQEHISAGGVFTYRPSEYLSLRLASGWVSYFLEGQEAGGNASQQGGIYAQFSLNHRLNPRISYNVTAGRELRTGWLANLQDLYYFRGRVVWNVILRSSLGTSFNYEHGTESWATGSETSDRYALGLDLTRSFSPKLSGSLSYWFFHKAATLQFHEYTQNRFVLELRYRF